MKCNPCKMCPNLVEPYGVDYYEEGYCYECVEMIFHAALADGYTVAEGVVMKPCTEYDYWCMGKTTDDGPHSKCGGGTGRAAHCRITCNCHGTGRVKAGGGGT